MNVRMRDRDSTLFIITAGEKSIIGELRWGWTFTRDVVFLRGRRVRGTEIIRIGKEANEIDGELLDGSNGRIFKSVESGKP
jgi:hypothetical protein